MAFDLFFLFPLVWSLSYHLLSFIFITSLSRFKWDFVTSSRIKGHDSQGQQANQQLHTRTRYNKERTLGDLASCPLLRRTILLLLLIAGVESNPGPCILTDHVIRRRLKQQVTWIAEFASESEEKIIVHLKSTREWVSAGIVFFDVEAWKPDGSPYNIPPLPCSSAPFNRILSLVKAKVQRPNDASEDPTLPPDVTPHKLPTIEVQCKPSRGKAREATTATPGSAAPDSTAMKAPPARTAARKPPPAKPSESTAVPKAAPFAHPTQVHLPSARPWGNSPSPSRPSDSRF